jgi:tripartite-type tricarboxylate transporter receptor subunit TctC
MRSCGQSLNLGALLGAVLTVTAAGPVAAQTYPDRPVRLIVAFPPGGVTDITARLMAAKLGPEIGGTVFVENIGGASGFVGTGAAARAAPDGYTLNLSNSSTHVFGPLISKNVPYDPARSFTEVAQLTAVPNLLVVPLSFPAHSVKELTELAAAQPGVLNYATFGKGGVAHLAAAMLQLMSNTKMTDIPYRGSAPAVADMMGGSVKLDFFIDSIVASLPYVRDGRLRALAVTSRARSKVAPEIPTVAETYPGYEITSWQGIGAPAGTPAPIIAKLNAGLKKVMVDPEIRGKLEALGAETMATSPEEAAENIASQLRKWKDILDKIGFKPE